MLPFKSAFTNILFSSGSIRRMASLKEDSSLNLLKKYGCPVMEYYTAKSGEDIGIMAKKIIENPSNLSNGGVIKALVACGGRALGKFKDGGCDSGVKIFRSSHEAQEIAKKMFGYHLVTKQTGKEGVLCDKLLIVPEIKYSSSIYAAFTIDRSSKTRISLIGSVNGGINIEETAKQNPKAIIKLAIDPSGKNLEQQTEVMVENFMITNERTKQELKRAIIYLFEAFKDSDCTLVEVNPIFIENKTGKVIFGDSKINIDSNALYRQEFVRNLLESNKSNTEKKLNYNYVKLDGNIGCLVNGAGLAMATVDQINLSGLKPSNFLDVGGGSDLESISQAMKVILQDQAVDRIFINIFGGIVSCENIMLALIETMKTNTKRKLPVVSRFFGNGSEKAKRLSEKIQTPFIIENDLDKAIDRLKEMK